MVLTSDFVAGSLPAWLGLAAGLVAAVAASAVAYRVLRRPITDISFPDNWSARSTSARSVEVNCSVQFAPAAGGAYQISKAVGRFRFGKGPRMTVLPDGDAAALTQVLDGAQAFRFTFQMPRPNAARAVEAEVKVKLMDGSRKAMTRTLNIES